MTTNYIFDKSFTALYRQLSKSNCERMVTEDGRRCIFCHFFGSFE